MEIEFRVFFDNPLQVSAQSDTARNMDRLIVRFTNTEMFYDEALGEPLSPKILEVKTLIVPTQIPDGLQGFMDVLVVITKIFAIGTGLIMLLNVIAGVELNQIWKAINVIQFLVYTDIWKISLPANVRIFFKQCDYFARFDWIPK